jgi:hypothetical protein
VFSAHDRATQPGAVFYGFESSERRVGTYYFYVNDPDFGAGFIKICTYFPYPAKVWCNGHEWAKRQAMREGIGFTALANGFATCTEPARLQAICDHFGPADMQAFFDRWTERIPTPFTPADHDADYWWELSMRQVELSRTLVFDDPRRARGFIESLVADNVGIGRPEAVSVVFAASFVATPPASSAPGCSAGALCLTVHAVTGFTNASLRGLVAGLLGRDYSTNQMTCDLRRLPLHGLIERIAHTNTYALTPDGIRVAVFFTKLDRRFVRSLFRL